jgi:Mo-co oxidoreductase dimerisation domain
MRGCVLGRYWHHRGHQHLVKLGVFVSQHDQAAASGAEPADALRAGVRTLARGIAFGGDSGISRVGFSGDGGKSWQEAQLGKDEGKYSFRQWQIRFSLPVAGEHVLMVRCTSSSGEVQPDTPNWNPAGFMRNVIEQTAVVVA